MIRVGNFEVEVVSGFAGLQTVRHRRFPDARGEFFEAWTLDLIRALAGEAPNFLQENVSVSARGVLRGLHMQVAPLAQAKLVRVARGRIFDVMAILGNDPALGIEWPLHGSQPLLSARDASAPPFSRIVEGAES